MNRADKLRFRSTQGKTRRRVAIITLLVVALSLFGLAAVTQAPSSAAVAPPSANGYFNVLPAGATLPTEAQCATEIHYSPWEPRADNYTANHTVPADPTLGNFGQWNSTWNSQYKPLIKGDFTGTTDELIQFYACKWGWSDNLIRAEAVVESNWHQSQVGDSSTSYGIMQVRYLYHPNVGCKVCTGSSYPNSQNSTAFNLDIFGAEMRGCVNGMSTYLGNTTNDVWDCIGQWYSGAWKDSGALKYEGWVQTALSNKAWLGWADQSGSLPTPSSGPTTTAAPTTQPATTTTKPVTTTTKPVTTTTVTPTTQPVTTTTQPADPYQQELAKLHSEIDAYCAAHGC